MVSSRFLTLYCKYFIGDKCKYLGIKNKQKKVRTGLQHTCYMSNAGNLHVVPTTCYRSFQCETVKVVSTYI